MQIIVQSMDQSDFNRWMDQQKAAASPAPSPSASPG
jgi:hypothetical protein